MFQDAPYAPSRGSFTSPVAPPIVDPDASPTISVAINCSWVPFIVGALQQLVLQATWKTDDPVALTLAQQRAMTLIALFMDAVVAEGSPCGGAIIPFACSYFFELRPDGWSVIPGNGDYQILVGYRSVLIEDDGGACTKYLDIQWFPPSGTVTLTAAHVVGIRQDDAGGAANGVFVTVGGVQSLFGSLPATAGSFDVVVSASPVSGVERIVVDLGTHLVPGPCSGTNPNVIQRVDLFGFAESDPCGS